MKKLGWLFLIFTATIFNSLAQRPTAPPVWTPIKQNYEVYISPNKTDREFEMATFVNGEKINGSPFLDTAWQKGTIILKDNKAFNNYKIRYNIFNQTVSFQINTESLEITDGIKEFTIQLNDNTKKRFVNANNFEKQNSILYFEVLNESKKGILLKSHTKTIQGNTDIANKTRFKRFEDTYNYFYYNSNKDVVSKIKRGGNNIQTILNLSEQQTKDLSISGYDFSAEESLLSFFKIYNTL